MIVRVSDIIKDAMGICGVTEIDETPSSSEMNLGFRTLNTMLGRWATQRLLLRGVASISFATWAGGASYTVGQGGAAVSAVKPTSVQFGSITDASMAYPLEVWSREMLESISDRAVARARPTCVVYDPGESQQTAHMGTFVLYPTPDRDYVVTLYGDTVFSEFSSIVDIITFEPIYYEALIYGLAYRLFRKYHGPAVAIPMDIVQIASNSLTALKTINSVRIPASMDIIERCGAYDVMTDSQG